MATTTKFQHISENGKVKLNFNDENTTTKSELANILRADADFEKIYEHLSEAWRLLKESKYEELFEFNASFGWTRLVKQKLKNTLTDEDYEKNNIHKEYYQAPLLMYDLHMGSSMSNYPTGDAPSGG